MNHHSESCQSETEQGEDRIFKLQMGICASSVARGSNVPQADYDFHVGEDASYQDQPITVVRRMGVPISGRPMLRIRFGDGREKTVCQDDLKHVPS